MAMSNSSLVSYTKLSPNCDHPRNHTIDKITIHHMAGDLSVETCGNLFANPNREASANYGIGSDGRVGLYVDEGDRAWASASPSNDNRAVNIEVANCATGGDWPVSSAAYNKLIDLCVDICQRNGIKALNYTGGADGNLTEHRMFVPTACPGPYLHERMSQIAAAVNSRLRAAEVPSEDNNTDTNENEEETINMELRMLKRGMEGNDVRAAMLLMKDKGYYPDEIWSGDKLFGPKMEAGLRRMQADHGLGVDGIIGNASWNFLLK